MTADPTLLGTVQANAAGTAAWVGTLAAQSADVTPTSTSTPIPPAEGTPLRARTGQCASAQGAEVQTRQGFCLVIPEAWRVFNVDGGLAASLKTTPGQAIALQPDWAEDPTICQVMLYVFTGTAEEHLSARHQEFSRRATVTELSAVQGYSLGTSSVLGFRWLNSDGEAGGVYAAALSPTCAMHISHTGTLCPVEDILPILETLRFNQIS